MATAGEAGQARVSRGASDPLTPDEAVDGEIWGSPPTALVAGEERVGGWFLAGERVGNAGQRVPRDSDR